MKEIFYLGLLIAGMGLSTLEAGAQVTSAQVQVMGVLGRVTATAGDGQMMTLKPKMMIAPGSTIKTGPRSAVDLFMGKSAGIVRVTENSILLLKEFKLMDSGGQTVVELDLNLQEGNLLGRDSHITTPSSHFEIKLPSGVVGISSGTFRINALGYIVLNEGALAYVHVDAAGELLAYKMAGPPGVYFSPVEGTKPAPEALIREVNLQLKSKLK